MGRDAVVELTFEVDDDNCMFVAASAAANATVTGEFAIQRSDGTILEYFSVEGVGAESERIVAAMDDHPSVDRIRVVHESESESDGENEPETDGRTVVEVIVDGDCVAATLADASAVIRSAVAVDGLARVVADVPADTDSQAVVETFLAAHRGQLLAKRSVPGRVPGVVDAEREALLATVTEKQRRALETALASGYFDWPRTSSARECAEALGVSQPTFSQHLRRAEEQLFTALFRPAFDAEGRDRSGGA